MLSLYKSIIAAQPKASSQQISKLQKLVRKYNLKWVPSLEQNNNAYFIASHLSVAKGLDSKDYAKHWSDNLSKTSSESGNPSLPGKEYRLEGESLAKFKKFYIKTYGESLGGINSLTILDWSKSFHYLVQGGSEAAKDFSKLGAESIIAEENKLNPYSYIYTNPFSVGDIWEGDTVDESILHAELEKILVRMRSLWVSEASIPDYFRDKGDNILPLCRRPDFTLVMRQSVTTIELKKDTFTGDHFSKKMYNACYVLNNVIHYDRPVHIIFTSPLGIDKSGRIALETFGEGYQDKTIEVGGRKIKYRAKVSFKSTQDLAVEWLRKVLNQNPENARYGLLKELADICSHVLPEGRVEALRQTLVNDIYELKAA